MKLGYGWTRFARELTLGSAILLSTPFLQAQAADIPPQRVVQVEAGTHTLVRETAVIKRVAVGDPAIADVNVINGREVLVSGKKLGITSLMVWAGPNPVEYRIRVGVIKDPVQPATNDPELRDAIVEKGYSLQGRLPNLMAHRRAQIAAANGKDAAPDSSVVDLDTQVMTNIKIAEVNRTTAQRYGFNIAKTGSKRGGSLSAPGQSVSSPLQDAFALTFSDISSGLDVLLNMLEGKGMARVLAEPSLTAMSGQTASFLAGGEFPIPVAQGGSTNGAITINYKEFGIRVNLTPTVLSRDRISLKVAPEVSDLDFTAAIQLNGVAVPALTVRRTDTTVELGDGESFVISGLVSSNLTQNVDKLPWLGDIPILGAFFKSASVDSQSRELIMVVTPHLVRPLAREAKLPALPGQAYDSTRPDYGRLIFEEKGDFKPADYGFGR